MTDNELIQCISESERTKALGITAIIRSEFESGNRERAVAAARIVKKIADDESLLGPHMLLEQAYDAIREDIREENNHA